MFIKPPLSSKYDMIFVRIKYNISSVLILYFVSIPLAYHLHVVDEGVSMLPGTLRVTTQGLSLDTVQYRQYSTMQCSTVQCSAVQYNAVQCSTMQYSTMQCSTVHCSAVQFSVRLDTVQYSLSVWTRIAFVICRLFSAMQ